MTQNPEDPSYQALDPNAIKALMLQGQPLKWIDVRTPMEWAHCRIDGAELKPLQDIVGWGEQLDPHGGPYVIYCHHGIRSRQACSYLASLGIKNLINLDGGIDLWAQTVDPRIPLY